MRYSLVLSTVAMTVVAGAAVVTPHVSDHAGIDHRGEDVQATAAEVEAKAMQGLEAATFKDRSPPSSAQTYNAWNLHCDGKYSADITRMYGHPSFIGTKFEDITFEMCNRVYLTCNQDCVTEYDKYMEHWPRPETDWPVLTSSALTNCVASCNAEGATDHGLLAEADNKPPNMERDADFAFYFKPVSLCIRACQKGFNKEVLDFQKEQDD